jgi:transposase-like protein
MARIQRQADWQPPRTARWSEDDAREVIEAWRRSGQSVAAFARHHGLGAERVLWWRRRLGEWLTRTTAMVVADRPQAFIPAAVLTQGENARRVMIRGAGRLAIEIEDAPASWVAGLVRELTRRR